MGMGVFFARGCCSDRWVDRFVQAIAIDRQAN
jgi:hypothetical protein